MRQCCFGLLIIGTVAACASNPDGPAANNLVGSPVSAAVEALGYLPDDQEHRADGTVYVWRIGNATVANRPASAEFTAPAIPRTCIVRVRTDAANLVRDIDYQGTRGRCAEVARQLRAAALYAHR